MTLDFAAKFEEGLAYADFLDRYASPDQRARWDAFHQSITLTEPQKQLLAGFEREMRVMISAGAWCGDCINQCPILNHFSLQNERIVIRYFDRDDHPDLADYLKTCGGNRVPSVLFLSEDNFVCGRYGDRTLATYRNLIQTVGAAYCPTGLVAEPESLQNAVIQEWLDQFERIQWMLRTSSRLRQKHGD